MKPTIGTTPYGISIDLRKRAVEAATFLAKNAGATVGRDGIEYLKSSVKMTVSTPITDIYSRAADLDKLNCFTMFDLSGIPDVPSILTLNDIAIDGKYVAPSMPHDFCNVWLNLTPFLRNEKNNVSYNRVPQITDTVQLASVIARGLLCMSYNDSPVWLTPSLRITLIETYSMCMTMRMKTLFDLNVEEFALCRLLFAAYMAQMLDDEAPKEIPPILYSCKFLFMDTGTPRTINDRFDGISDVRARISPHMDLSIDTICNILREKGPDRMKKLLKPAAFYQFMSRSPTDSQSMLLAMDYPPYFVHMLLNNMKGGKNPFFQSLIRFGDMRRTLVRFVDDLISSKLFIDRVAR